MKAWAPFPASSGSVLPQPFSFTTSRATNARHADRAEISPLPTSFTINIPHQVQPELSRFSPRDLVVICILYTKYLPTWPNSLYVSWEILMETSSNCIRITFCLFLTSSESAVRHGWLYLGHDMDRVSV